jgi:hypothetical protein
MHGACTFPVSIGPVCFIKTYHPTISGRDSICLLDGRWRPQDHIARESIWSVCF